MSNRVKITEIKETYTVKRKVKNKVGEYVTVDKTYWRYKEVNFVSGWARFLHFLMDRIFFYLFEYIFALGLGVFIALLGGADWIQTLNTRMIDIVLYLLLYPAYYFIFEAAAQGSLAKLILKRVVVNEYGDKPTTKQIFIRSISRIVPFEQLSCFGKTGWHDNWSETYVIRKKDLEELQTLAKLQVYLAETKTEKEEETKPLEY